MRRTSVSLPTKQIAHDPFEKPDRYEGGSHRPGLLAKMQSAWASQSQRARYIKTGAILFFVLFLFYYFSPSGVDLYNGGRETPAFLARLAHMRSRMIFFSSPPPG